MPTCLWSVRQIPEGESPKPPDLPKSLAISTGRQTLVIPLIGVRSQAWEKR